MVPFREEEEYNEHVKLEHFNVYSFDVMPYVCDVNIYKGNFMRYKRYFSWYERIRRKNPKIFFQLLKEDFVKIFPHFKYPGSINVNVSLTMETPNKDSIDNPFRFVDFGLQTEFYPLSSDDVDSTIKSIIDNLEQRFEEGTNRGSSLSLFAFNSVRITNAVIVPKRHIK